MGLVENSIRGDADVAVAATVCQRGKRRTLVLCINMTAQPQELRAGSLFGIFVPLEEDQSSEGCSIGQCAKIQDVGKCPEHVSTLLAQALKICTTPKRKNKFDICWPHMLMFSAAGKQVSQGRIWCDTKLQYTPVLHRSGSHPRNALLRRIEIWKSSFRNWFHRV